MSSRPPATATAAAGSAAAGSTAPALVTLPSDNPQQIKKFRQSMRTSPAFTVSMPSALFTIQFFSQIQFSSLAKIVYVKLDRFMIRAKKAAGFLITRRSYLEEADGVPVLAHSANSFFIPITSAANFFTDETVEALKEANEGFDEEIKNAPGDLATWYVSLRPESKYSRSVGKSKSSGEFCVCFSNYFLVKEALKNRGYEDSIDDPKVADNVAHTMTDKVIVQLVLTDGLEAPLLNLTCTYDEVLELLGDYDVRSFIEEEIATHETDVAALLPGGQKIAGGLVASQQI